MTNFPWAPSTPALALFALAGVAQSVAPAADLSRYRDFQFGTDLATVAGLAGMNPSQAKVVHSRPTLIQELTLRPQPLGIASHPEAAHEIVFTFYGGELFQIAVDYDQNETEGLTNADFVDAISAIYGPGIKPPVPVAGATVGYTEPKEILAQWQDSEYRFELLGSRYGTPFRLVGILKRLEAPALAATLEAKRLDDLEAPQRDAARLAGEEAVTNAKLEKARIVNKPKARP